MGSGEWREFLGYLRRIWNVATLRVKTDAAREEETERQKCWQMSRIEIEGLARRWVPHCAAFGLWSLQILHTKSKS
nr:hypothetical protein Itr_chr11CG23770 [Ipomoea trifida]